MIEELQRRRGTRRRTGSGTELLTPGETARSRSSTPATSVRYLVPSMGAKGVRVVAALGAKAEAKGVVFEGGVRVTGFRHPRGTGARRPDRSRRRGVRAGPRVRGHLGTDDRPVGGCADPLAVVQHQLVWTEPLPELAADRDREVVHPILRHQDLSLYSASAAIGTRSGTTGTSRSCSSRTTSARIATASRSRASSRSRPRTSGFAFAERTAGSSRPCGEDRRLDRDQRHVLVHAGHGLDRG